MSEIGIFILGIVIGIGLMMLYLAYKFKTILNELDQYIDKAIDSTLLGLTVEKHDGVYRFYRAKDKQFILQTTTLDNIKELFKAEYPDKTCYIEDGDPEVLLEIKDILKK